MSLEKIKQNLKLEYPQIQFIENFEIVKKPCYSKGFATWLSEFGYLEEYDIDVPIYIIGREDEIELTDAIKEDIQACWNAASNPSKVFLFLSGYNTTETRWGDYYIYLNIGVCVI